MKQSELIPLKSAAASTTSVQFDLGDIISGSIEVEFSGSDVVGTLTLEARNVETTSWKTVANSSQAITASADHMWVFTDSAGFRFVRIAWAYTSGTGNISANLLGKELKVIGA